MPRVWTRLQEGGRGEEVFFADGGTLVADGGATSASLQQSKERDGFWAPGWKIMPKPVLLWLSSQTSCVTLGSCFYLFESQGALSAKRRIVIQYLGPQGLPRGGL